jgi:tetratricopeptide (TPR) repeat protein
MGGEAPALPRHTAAAFDQANKLFDQGKFLEAAAAYERLVTNGTVSPALCFNLGNAWFKAGQLGRAIASYRLGERLAPRDPDIRANLRFARNSVVGGAPPNPPAWRRWATQLTLNEWTILTAALFWTALALLVVIQMRPEFKRPLRRYVVVLGLGSVLSVLGLVIARQERYGAVCAIVVVRETILRHGPLEESPSLQTLHDGQELTVIDQKNEWLRLAGANRGVGWLKRDQVVVLEQ